MVTNKNKILDKIVAGYYQCKTIQSLLNGTGSKKTFTYSGYVVVVLYK